MQDYLLFRSSIFLFMTEITIILINPKAIISILLIYGMMLKERMFTIFGIQLRIALGM